MAQAAAQASRASLDRARAERTAFQNQLDGRRRKGMAVWEWAATTESHLELARREQGAADDLHQALAEVSAKRLLAEEAERRQKALEKLRDQQFEAYRYAEATADQIATDEMAQRARRTGRGGV